MVLNDLITLTKKYFDQTITDAELKVLEKFLEDEDNKKTFKKLASKDYKRLTNNVSSDYKIAFDKALGNQRKKNFLLKKAHAPFYKYAAAVVVLFGLGFALKQAISSKNEIETIEKVSENQIELLLQDGSRQVLTPEVSGSIKTVSKSVIGYVNQGKLQYLKQETDAVLVFNTIKVPYGRKFSLELSDGTTVEMNSGSSLRYPVTFLKDGERKVFLEGEAYFDVAKNVNNPFIVHANDLNVKVLGTRFNISAYEEDEAIYTTLQEGSVTVYDIHENKLQLAPYEQSSWNKSDKSLRKEIVDITPFLAWREGRVIFKNTTFNAIVKKLQRKHDVIIINENQQIENEKFTAAFDNESIEQVLQYFSESYEFKFKRNGKMITIE